MTDWLGFCWWVFQRPLWIGISDFILQNSDFKFHQSDVPTEILCFYVDIYFLWTHSEGSVNTLSCLSAYWMLYHCLRRWSNIKTTLGRRFVFDRATTVILIVKCSTNVPDDHSKHPRWVQWRASVCKTVPALKQHWANAIWLSNLAFKGLIMWNAVTSLGENKNV